MKYFKKTFIRYVAMGLAMTCVSFLLGKCNVHALEIVPNRFDTFSNSTVLSNSNDIYQIDINGTTFNAASSQIMGNMSGFRFAYYTGQFSSIVGKTGYLFYQIASFAAQGPIGSYIMVGNNNYSCFTNTVDKINNSSSVANVYITTVICPNVYFSSDWVDIHGVISPSAISGNATSYVSYRVSFVENSNNKDVITAIGENTDKTNEKIDKTNENIEKVDDTINNSDVEDSTSSATGFFNDFENEDYGFSDIIKMPLTFINDLTSSTCTDLVLPLPFVDKNVSLPCMTNIYKQHFGAFLTIYQTITFGVVAYWVCINLFAMVKGFKDPESDKVEVFDL